MASSEKENIVYDKSVIEFVTVAVEACVFLEQNESTSREVWVDKMLKLLSLLYVKALFLPDTEISQEDFSASFVHEEDYIRIVNVVSSVMGEEDVFLDVFVEDMKYSDTPVSTLVSENIADIYQDIRNFISVYQYGLTDQMNDALYQCKENFRLYWGQKLVNVMRPLHALNCMYMEHNNEDNELLEEDLWD